jgi:hypothetical protein
MYYSNYFDTAVTTKSEKNDMAAFRVLVVALSDFAALSGKLWILD